MMLSQRLHLHRPFPIQIVFVSLASCPHARRGPEYDRTLR